MTHGMITKTTDVTTMQFDWDEIKAGANQAKHGVSFSTAARVFLDQHRIETLDDRNHYGEDRWVTIGFVDPSLLYVVYTVRNGETIRLISARKANEKEREQYRQTNA